MNTPNHATDQQIAELMGDDDVPPMLEVHVGQAIVVPWSNGHGFSTYRVADTKLGLGHALERVADVEYTGVVT